MSGALSPASVGRDPPPLLSNHPPVASPADWIGDERQGLFIYLHLGASALPTACS
jgi:hypothetical protein